LRVTSGIIFRSVMMACSSAEPHLQARAAGSAATVRATTLHAFSAFWTRLLMIWFTVTAS
jgi:hypothetical protein